MVWTEITRLKYRREGLRYASDTTDAEWAVISPHLPEPFRRGRPRRVDLRAVVNAIFYIGQSGCPWRLLPKDLPAFTTVQGYFYRWRDDGTWARINHALVMAVREAMGREASPTAGVIDRQSVHRHELAAARRLRLEGAPPPAAPLPPDEGEHQAPQASGHPPGRSCR